MQNNSKKNRNRTLLGILTLVLGIIFVIIGIHRTEHTTVEQKSSIICLECIGIG